MKIADFLCTNKDLMYVFALVMSRDMVDRSPAEQLFCRYQKIFLSVSKKIFQEIFFYTFKKYVPDFFDSDKKVAQLDKSCVPTMAIYIFSLDK